MFRIKAIGKALLSLAIIGIGVCDVALGVPNALIAIADAIDGKPKSTHINVEVKRDGSEGTSEPV